MIKQFLAKQNGFDKIVRVGDSLTIRLPSESQARDYADRMLSAYEETVLWRFDRNVSCDPIAGTEPQEWSFDLVQIKPSNRGGSRTGAGRPPKDPSGAKEQASWWLAPDILKHIRTKENQAEYLESLVRQDMQSS